MTQLQAGGWGLKIVLSTAEKYKSVSLLPCGTTLEDFGGIGKPISCAVKLPERAAWQDIRRQVKRLMRTIVRSLSHSIVWTGGLVSRGEKSMSKEHGRQEL